MTDLSDLMEIKTAIVEIRGEIRTMTEAMRSGDRDSASGVRLLAQTVENLAKNQAEQRADLKEAMDKFDQRTDMLRELGAQQANAVRASLESQIRDHADHEGPHAKTLGARLVVLEDFKNRVIGALLLITAVGVGNFILIFNRT